MAKVQNVRVNLLVPITFALIIWITLTSSLESFPQSNLTMFGDKQE
jgi:hypothetical protein